MKKIKQIFDLFKNYDYYVKNNESLQTESRQTSFEAYANYETFKYSL